MYIHQIIEARLSSLKLYDKEGKKVDTMRCVHEYNCIKNQLLNMYTEDDIVGIHFSKDYRYILTLLACMAIELPYIPLSIDWPKDRIDQVAELSGCHVIVEEMFNYDNFDNITHFKSFKNDILYIIFTSGSTGAPKGVKISRTAYEAFLLWSDSYFSDITETDRMLLTTDFTFDISLVDISLLLTKNVSLYVSNFNNNVFKMLFELEKYKITTHSTVPYNYSMIMHEDIYDKADLSALKHIMIGGARFPNNLYANFQKYLPHCTIYNFYGPTEATIYCAIHKFEYKQSEIHQSNITIGQAFGKNKFSIIEGELYISGAQLMNGYIHNEAKTQESLVLLDGVVYYKSGDVVFQNEEGNYFIVGRKDDTIKVTGYRVNLSDIDAYLLQLNYVNNVATIAIANETSENDLISYMILDSQTITSKQIRTDLKEIMPGYQIPKSIKIVDQFPLNNSGKICKLTLKQMFLN